MFIEKWCRCWGDGSIIGAGSVVIKDILSENEMTTAFELFKKDWLTVSPNFDFENPDT